jgi:hypothetical protein
MNKTYRYRLEVDFNEPIRFGDLPHFIAQAMYPEVGSMRYGAARLNLEAELEVAAQNREVIVRNVLSLGPSTLLVGEALKSAIVFADDILDYLGGRGIELVNSSLIKSKTQESKKNTWGELELRKLTAKSLEPGMNHRKLAEYYGVSRQFISKKLNDAADLDTPKKATFLNPLEGKSRK